MNDILSIEALYHELQVSYISQIVKLQFDVILTRVEKGYIISGIVGAMSSLMKMQINQEKANQTITKITDAFIIKYVVLF
jgi:hypothetical protein